MKSRLSGAQLWVCLGGPRPTHKTAGPTWIPLNISKNKITAKNPIFSMHTFVCQYFHQFSTFIGPIQLCWSMAAIQHKCYQDYWFHSHHCTVRWYIHAFHTVVQYIMYDCTKSLHTTILSLSVSLSASHSHTCTCARAHTHTHTHTHTPRESLDTTLNTT